MESCRAEPRAANRSGRHAPLSIAVPRAATLSFVMNAIGVDPALFGGYPLRGETRRKDLTEFQKVSKAP
jgi:hypothetical protein